MIKFFERSDYKIKHETINTTTSTLKNKSSNKNIKDIPNINRKIKNKITNKTIDAEHKCAEIGFKKGTENYGKCVLKLLDLK